MKKFARSRNIIDKNEHVTPDLLPRGLQNDHRSDHKIANSEGQTDFGGVLDPNSDLIDRINGRLQTDNADLGAVQKVNNVQDKMIDVVKSDKILKVTLDKNNKKDKKNEKHPKSDQNPITKYAINPPENKVVYERFSDLPCNSIVSLPNQSIAKEVGQGSSRKVIGRRRKVSKKEEDSMDNRVNLITKYFPRDNEGLQNTNGKRKYQSEPTEVCKKSRLGKSD